MIRAFVRRLARGSYKALKKAQQSKKGIWSDSKKLGEEVHHIIEKRLMNYGGKNNPFKKIWGNSNDMPAIVLDKGAHKIITKRWRKALPYKGSKGFKKGGYTVQEVYDAAHAVYAGYPEQLRQVVTALLPYL
jgi:hypothetical protein